MLDPASEARGPDTAPTLTRGHSPSTTVAEQPDLLLIERARSGSDAAVEALVRRYARRLFRVARSVILDDERAEAAVQAACLGAFGDLGRYEPTGKFAAWLTRLTYQHARADRHPGSRASQTAAARAGQPAELSELAHAVDALPEVFRIVFVLRVIEGISGIESAASLGVHETTIRTRLYRAHRRLDADLVRAIRLQPDLMALPAGADQRLVSATLAHLPRTSAAGGPRT